MKRKPWAFGVLGMALIGSGMLAESPRELTFAGHYALGGPAPVQQADTYCTDAQYCGRSRALQADWGGVAGEEINAGSRPTDTYLF